MQTNKPTPSVHLALAAVQIMFASLSVAGKIVLAEMPARGVVAIRVSVAALIFVAVRFFSPRERVTAPDLLRLAVYSFFGIIANQIIFIEGLQRTTAINAVVIGAVIPVFTVGVAVVLRREKATVARLVGLALGLGGALYIVSGRGKFDAGYVTGNLLIMCNSLSFAIYLVISRPILARYRTVTVVTWTFLFGAIGVIPFGATDAFAHAHMSATAWSALAWIILFPTVGTYFLNAFALKRAPSSLVAVYVYLQPLMGGLMAAAVLHERPAPTTLVGGLGIAAGIAVVTLL